MKWKTKSQVKSSWTNQSLEKQKPFGNKNFIITWFRLEFDKENKENISEWQILSELLRIIEQIEKETQAISKTR